MLILILIGLTAFSIVLFIDPSEFHAIKWYFFAMATCGFFSLWGLFKIGFRTVLNNLG